MLVNENQVYPQHGDFHKIIKFCGNISVIVHCKVKTRSYLGNMDIKVAFPQSAIYRANV